MKFQKNGRTWKAEKIIGNFYDLYERRGGHWVYYATVDRAQLDREAGR